jgi:hypothetical protein
LSQEYVLRLTSEKPCEVSGLVLISRQGNLPIHNMDGERAAVFNQISLGIKPVFLALGVLTKGSFIKLFFENPHDNSRFRLQHPEKKHLTIR